MANAAIEKLILARAGLHPESIGSGNIARAVASAMTRAGLRDEAEYLDLLSSSTGEMQGLINALVIPETWFFRDGEPFVFLKKYVQATWLPANPGRKLRVLSIPCSTGEEPYSIALTLLEAGLKPGQFHIDAADISVEAIEKAKRACYRERSFRDKLAECYARYFHRTEEGLALDQNVAQLVSFHLDNLVHPSFLANREPYDVVFCRNMVIYLSADARELVLKNLARLIVPRGLLFAGHSEISFFQNAGYTPVPHAHSFACVQGRAPAREHPTTAARRSAAERGRARPRRAPAIAATAPAKPAAEPEESGLDAARLLADQGQLARAGELCVQYLRNRPADAKAQCLLGLIHQAMDRLEAAEACYTKALYLDPQCVEALVHLALCHERRGDRQQADLMRERARRIETALKRTA